jgi:uncharacterized protein (DUF736 family)
MKVQLHNDITTIRSGLKMKDLKMLKEQAPERLIMRDHKDNEVFRINTGDTGSLSKLGVTFDREDEDGYAYVSIKMEDTVTKQYIKENSGYILANLNNFESYIKQDLEELNKDLDGLFE